MPDLSNQRRLAASLLKCGEGRVWIDPASQEELADAVTRSDVRSAIKARVIRRTPIAGTSRARARRHAKEVGKGRHSGPGSRRSSRPRRRAFRRSRTGLASSSTEPTFIILARDLGQTNFAS